MAKDGRPGKCSVCGQAAKGIFYNVLSCSGCRAFYQRNTLRGMKYVCKGNSQCHPNGKYGRMTSTRYQKWCKACRYQRYIDLILDNSTEIYDTLGKNDSRQKARPRQHVDFTTTDAPDDKNYQINSAESPIKTVKTPLTFPMEYAFCGIIEPLKFGSEISILPFRETDLQLQSSEKDCPIAHAPPVDIATSESWDGSELAASPVLHTVEYLGRSEAYKVGMSHTIAATKMAMDCAYRDHISARTTVVHKREPGKHAGGRKLRTAGSDEIADFVGVQTFMAMLPGVIQLDPSARQLLNPWKVALCSWVHQAPFWTDIHTQLDEIYCLQYLDQPYFCEDDFSYEAAVYDICHIIRNLELDNIERHLLMAVIMLEPDEENVTNVEWHALHHHYVNALLFAIDSRCKNYSHLAMVCRKLEGFFDAIKTVVPAISRVTSKTSTEYSVFCSS